MFILRSLTRSAIRSILNSIEDRQWRFIAQQSRAYAPPKAQSRPITAAGTCCRRHDAVEQARTLSSASVDVGHVSSGTEIHSYSQDLQTVLTVYELHAIQTVDPEFIVCCAKLCKALKALESSGVTTIMISK